MPLLSIFYGNPLLILFTPIPFFSHPKKINLTDDDLNYLQLKIVLFKEFDTMCYSYNFPVAKFIVHDWGDKVDSGTGSPLPARHATQAGRPYDNPMPESTISHSQGL